MFLKQPMLYHIYGPLVEDLDLLVLIEVWLIKTLNHHMLFQVEILQR